ncbi:MAG: glycosyltransferase [bacterium]|nr:glycosyltransferase [bacterium]
MKPDLVVLDTCTEHSARFLANCLRILGGSFRIHGFYCWLFAEGDLEILAPYRFRRLGEEEFGGEALERILAGIRPSRVLCWNKHHPLYERPLRFIREELPACGVVYAEAGWFPQREHVYFDGRGINADSSIAEMTAAEVRRLPLDRPALEAFRSGYRGGRAIGDDGFVFCPLQIADDMNIVQFSPWRDMAAFVRHMASALPGEEIVCRCHPLDPDKERLLRLGEEIPGVRVEEGGDLRDSLARCGCVVGINSTVLLEALLFDKPVTYLGRGIGSGKEGVFNYDLPAARRFEVDRDLRDRFLHDLIFNRQVSMKDPDPERLLRVFAAGEGVAPGAARRHSLRRSYEEGMAEAVSKVDGEGRPAALRHLGALARDFLGALVRPRDGLSTAARKGARLLGCLRRSGGVFLRPRAFLREWREGRAKAARGRGALPPAEAWAEIAHPVNARIGPVTLLGWTERNRVLTLFFLPHRKPRDNFLVFTHLYPDDPGALPEERRSVGFLNLDHAPIGGTRRWKRGLACRDDLFIETIPRASYTAHVGLLDPVTLRREAVEGSSDGAVGIGPLELREPFSMPASSTGPGGFSVIVCTHNRADYLRKAVESLFALDYPRDRYEIIVVDNGSADATRETAAALREASPVPFRYCFEPVLGLSNARNTGIRHSRYDLVAYLDDDAAADRRWLAAFDETIRRFHADVVGGKVVPVPVEGFDLPPWFDTPYVWGFYGLDYERRGRPERVIRIQHPDYLGGGNSCYRKELLNLPWARFHGRLGRTGKRLYQGEETLLNFFLSRNGYRIYYTADAVIYHFVDPERLNRKYVMRKAFWGGYSDALMHRKMFGLGFVIGHGPRRLGRSLRAFRAARRAGEDDAEIFEKKGLLLHDAGYLLRLFRFMEMARSR